MESMESMESPRKYMAVRRLDWLLLANVYLGLKIAKIVSSYWNVDLISVAQVYSSCCSKLKITVLSRWTHSATLCDVEPPVDLHLLWIATFQLPSFEIFPMLTNRTRIVFAKRNNLTLGFLTMLFNLINVWSETSSVIFIRPIAIILWISIEKFKFWIQKIFEVFSRFRYAGLQQ